MSSMQNEVTLSDARRSCGLQGWDICFQGEENTVLNAQLIGFIPRCLWLPVKGPLAVGPSSKTQTHAWCTADSALAKESVHIASVLLPK